MSEQTKPQEPKQPRRIDTAHELVGLIKDFASLHEIGYSDAILTHLYFDQLVAEARAVEAARQQQSQVQVAMAQMKMQQQFQKKPGIRRK